MSREVLFKAKGQISGKWYEGLLVRLDKDVCHIKDNHHTEWICDTETVCQYIGLTDINDKKIFENDIVKLRIAYVGGGVRQYTCLVKFSAYGVVFQDVKYKECAFRYGDDVGRDDIEVLGDIFDNPELLKY